MKKQQDKYWLPAFGIERVIDGLVLRHTSRGTQEAILELPADCARFAAAMRRRGATELAVICARESTDFSFLTLFPFLTSIRIHGKLYCENLNTLESLEQLGSLEISGVVRGSVDFGSMAALESVQMPYWPGGTSIFRAPRLQRLELEYLKASDCDQFANLRNLKALCICNSAVTDLSAVGKLRKIHAFKLILLPKLSNIEFLSRLPQIRTLQIECCKRIRDISAMSKLSKLEFLNFCDNKEIESIKALNGLRKLKWCYLYGDTRILDHDLSPLVRRTPYHDLLFKNRREYTHRLEEFAVTRKEHRLQKYRLWYLTEADEASFATTDECFGFK